MSDIVYAKKVIKGDRDDIEVYEVNPNDSVLSARTPQAGEFLRESYYSGI